jgi:deazaflavin-dependent oxidoreductase (nitroreductase family)
MRTEWPFGFERKGTLKISTIGRRTGRRHGVTTWFAVDTDGRIFIATQDTGRDWVRNVAKNPSVEVTIGEATRKMKVLPLKTDSDRQYVSDLYANKYLSARLGRLLRPKGFAKYGAFELQSE